MATSIHMGDLWHDPGRREVSVSLIGEQIILCPHLVRFLAEEAEFRPIVTTVPRSLDAPSLGRVVRGMLEFSLVVDTEREADEVPDWPESAIDGEDDVLPEFMGGAPGNREAVEIAPPSEDEQARWAEEERRQAWPMELVRRLAGVASIDDLTRGALACTVRQSQGRLVICPWRVVDPTHPEARRAVLDDAALSIPFDSPEAEVGAAVRAGLERARNPWLPFSELLRLAPSKSSGGESGSGSVAESEWVPSNYSFIHGGEMNRTEFWNVITTTRPQPYDAAPHLENLAGRLATLDPKEIASFEKHHLDLVLEAYDARLLEVMWILTGGGPGDEGCSDFNAWLILQGKKVFEQILKAPERLPELYPPGTEIYCSGLGSLACTAYEETTGREDFDAFYEQLYEPFRWPDAPKGAKVDPRTEDEEVLEKRLRKKYPGLWEYFAQYD